MADDGITSSRDLELGQQIVAEELERATATSSLTREDLELGLQNVAEELEPATATSSLTREDLEIGQNVADEEPSRRGDPSIADLDDYKIQVIISPPDHIPSTSHNEQTIDTGVDDPYMADQEKLHDYACEGNWESAKFIFDRYPEMKRIPLNKEGHTALQLAILKDKRNFVGRLVKRMTTEELKIQNRYGYTALQIAVNENNIDCFLLLVEHVTAEELKIQNIYGYTALHIAVWRENIDYFQLLVKHMTTEGLKLQDKKGNTALHMAVYENKIDCYQLLVQLMTLEGLKIQNSNGNTALHIAVYNNNFDCFQLLVERMTTKELEIQNNDGNTALHIAVYENKIDCFQLLVQRMTTEDREHIAVVEDHLDCLLPVAKHMRRKNLKITNNDGNTALHVAMEKYNIECFKRFLKHLTTEDLQIKDNAGNTAIHIAARLNKIDFAQLLKEHMTPKDLRIQNNDGDTALHVAVKNNNIEFLLLLAEHMTTEDLQIHNEAGNTVLHLAARLSQINLERMFFMTISYNIYDAAVKLFDMHPDALAIARDRDEEKLTALHMLARKDGKEHVKQMEEENSKDQLFQKLWTKVRQLPDVEKMLDLISNPSPVLFDAVKSGNTDVVIWVLDENPEVLEIKYSTKGQNLLHLAALNGRKSIFDFILKKKTADILKSEVDNDGNNVLHFAAQYKSKSSAELRPNIELDIALKWFKEAGNKLPPELRTMKNKGGKTPTDIFNADHSEVCKQVKDAAKGISDSGMIVQHLLFR